MHVHSPQPPHMMPPQPHHQQLPQHMPHINHPPHMPHQPHHGGPMQQHLGIPPHYEQDAHLRQMASPSVMPSPSLHNATVAPYQQSPVPHPSQLAMYPGQQGAIGQYPVPGGPGGPQFGFYNNGYRGPAGNPMMMHGPQPVPYPGQQMGSQFVPAQMYSPQQQQAYMHNGPPPPGSQGYPSPGRGAPMMMHQGSSQGAPGGAQMMPYGMQPGQGGPVYGQQQQSELLPTSGPSWLPQRSQSTVPFSSAVSSPHVRYNQMHVQPTSIPSVAPTPGTPLLSPALAAFASPTLAPASGYSSQPLQRSQTANKALDDSRGAGGGYGGRGRGGNKSYHGHGGNGGHGGRGGRGGGYGGPMHGRQEGFVDTYSNDGSMYAVGMMRGQPPPPHQGGPPPQYYHGPGPQNHYPPGGRNNGYGPQQHQMQPPPPQPPQQQQQQMAPPPPPPQQPMEAVTGEEAK